MTLGAAGRVGLAADFDGATGAIDVGTPAALGGLAAVTVEAWVRLDGHTTHGSGIVLKAGGNGNVDFGLLVDDSPAGSVWWIAASTDGTYGYRSIQTAGDLARLGTWVHLAGVYEVASNAAHLRRRDRGRCEHVPLIRRRRRSSDGRHRSAAHRQLRLGWRLRDRLRGRAHR